MKRLVLSIALGVALLGSGCSNAQSNSEETTQAEGVINKDVDVDEFSKLVAQDNGLLLDVRTDQEFAAGHLEGAKQIDFYAADFQQKVKELDKETPVYIYCRSGGRSGQAAKMMKGMGFKAVYNLEGGIMAWQRKGKPVKQ